jgi:hypothetical protein
MGLDKISGIWLYIYVLFIYFVSVIIGYFSKYRKFFWIGASPIFLLVSIKGIMSPDFYRYALTYENIKEFGIETFEPFFLLVGKIFKFFNLGYDSFFIFYALLTIIFILYGIFLNIKTYWKRCFAFFLFVSTPGFYLNMFVEMRQILAVAFVFFVISLIINNRLKNTFLANILLLLSPLFHYSAIFFVMFFLLFKRRLVKFYSLKLYLFYPIAVLLLIIIFRIDFYIYSGIFHLLSFFDPYFPIIGKYMKYLSIIIEHYGAEQVQFQLIKNIFYSINLIILAYLIETFGLKSNRLIVFTLNLLYIGIILLNLSFYNAVFSRLCYYFFIFNIVLLPEVIFSIKNKETKYMILILYYIIYTIMFIKGLFYYSTEAQDYIFLKYKTLWSD